jgi:hypothetical protein
VEITRRTWGTQLWSVPKNQNESEKDLLAKRAEVCSFFGYLLWKKVWITFANSSANLQFIILSTPFVFFYVL